MINIFLKKRKNSEFEDEILLDNLCCASPGIFRSRATELLVCLWLDCCAITSRSLVRVHSISLNNCKFNLHNFSAPLFQKKKKNHRIAIQLLCASVLEKEITPDKLLLIIFSLILLKPPAACQILELKKKP